MQHRDTGIEQRLGGKFMIDSGGLHHRVPVFGAYRPRPLRLLGRRSLRDLAQ